jgi:O-antigen/teichoic acid export membrane protein
MDFGSLVERRNGDAHEILKRIAVKEHRFTFFRQSAWMMMATVGSSVFMALVQAAAQRMPKQPVDEYGAFAALMEVLGQMSIPITGILMVFAQQTVTANTDELRRQLVGTTRGIIGGVFVLWTVATAAALFFQAPLLRGLKLPNAAAWWLTMFVGLAALITPVLTGILQGEQKFTWVGLASVVNGFGRFCGVLIAVVWLSRGAAGAMAGVLAGQLCTLALVAWTTRWIWRTPAAPFAWGAWLKQVLPLTLGLAAPIYVFTQDMITVQQFYEPGATSAYGAARVVGRTLFFITAPITAVMFPKIVRSAAQLEKTDVLAQAVGVTALIGGVAAFACTVLPELPLRILSGERYLQTAWLVPWFAWCMLPLALANLLVTNLLARKHFEAVPWLLAIAAGYGVTLRYTYANYLSVIWTLGAFSLLLMAVASVFTFRAARQH